jgi:hypothetical protein
VIFGKKVKDFRQEFLATLPFDYKNEDSFKLISNAYALIDQYFIKLTQIK